jgi:hypothetical protein
LQAKYVDVDRLPHFAKSWWYGYTAGFATAADHFVELLFAHSWRCGVSALTSRQGARGVIFCRNWI